MLKKIIFVFLLILAIVVGIAFAVDFAVRDNKTAVDKPSKSEVPIINDNNPIINMADSYKPEKEIKFKDMNLYNRLAEVMDTYTDYLNNKEYDKAYSLLSDEYKQTSGLDIDTFKANYESVFTDIKIADITDYYKVGNNRYVCNVTFITDQVGEDSTTPEASHDVVDVAVITLNDVSSYSIALNGYIGTESVNYIKDIDTMQFNLNSISLYEGRTKFTITVKNKTDFDLYLTSTDDGSDIYVVNKEKYKAPLNMIGYNREDFKIVGQGERSMELLFDQNFANNMKSLNFVGINSQGNVEKLDFQF